MGSSRVGVDMNPGLNVLGLRSLWDVWVELCGCGLGPQHHSPWEFISDEARLPQTSQTASWIWTGRYHAPPMPPTPT